MAPERPEIQPYPSPKAADTGSPQLIRGLGLVQAAALNVANMVGIGPFIAFGLLVREQYTIIGG